jgi:hypothetical protein
MKVASRLSGLTSPLEDSPHHTDTFASLIILMLRVDFRWPGTHSYVDVPLSLKLVSSDQTVKLAKYPFRHTQFYCTIWIVLIYNYEK